MKKAKLEVIRIKEDVIATSSLCQHYTTSVDFGGGGQGHVKISNFVNTSTFHMEFYNYESGKLIHYNGEGSDLTNYPDSDITGNGWYYWDGTEYKPCEKQNDEAHPATGKPI